MEQYSLPIQLLSGNVAGWMAISASQPFDFLKTKYQLNQHVCFNTLKQMILKDGFRVLYKGASSIYFFSGIIFSIQLSTFETIHHYMIKHNYLQEKESRVNQLMLTGAIVGLISASICTPTQYTKIHAQISNQQNSRGSFSRIIDLIKTQKYIGLRKLYTGHMWTLMRDVPGLSLFYGGFHSILYQICPQRQLATLYQQLFASSIVAFGFSALTYPFDTIKTKTQYKNNHLKDILKQKFWRQRSFIKGYKAAVLRGVIMDTIGLTIYENLRNLFYKNMNY